MVLKNLTYTVKFSRHEVYEGETFEIVEEVVNDKSFPVPWAKTEVCTSRWLEFSGTSAARASDTRFVPSVFALRPHQKCTRTRTVTACKRGYFRLENATLIGSDLLGIVQVSRTIKIDEAVRVLPSPYEVGEGDLSDRELYGEIMTRRFICDDPFLISGAREYTGHESMNRIHWQGTARMGQLMAFNNDYSTTERAVIVMNMQRSPIGDPHPIIQGDEETYIKAAAFISGMYISRGIKTDICTNGSMTGGDYFAGGNMQDDYVKLLRSLSAVENFCDTDICDYLSGIDFSQKTDIAVITPYIDARLIAFAYNMRRKNINIFFYCNEENAADDYRIIRIGKINRYYFLRE